MEDGFAEFKTWYKGLPLVSRTYVSLCFVTTVLFSLRLIGVGYLYYTFQKGILEFQIWRIITCGFFLGKFDFEFLFMLYFGYCAISRLEVDVFNESINYADFLWLFLWAHMMMVLAASFLDLYFIGKGFIFCMLYIWCKRRPFEILRYWFGIQVKSAYFPWVYMGFNVLMGDSFIPYVIGFGIGHLYIFIKDIALVKYHRDYLPTPQFFVRLTNKYILKKQEAENTVNPPRFFGGRGVRIE